MSIPRLSIEHTALLVVDVQERLLPIMPQPDALCDRIATLIQGAAALELPIIVTEQYPKGLGPTVQAVAKHLPDDAMHFEKLKFSACIEAVRHHLQDKGMRAVVICGIEAHVCVMQSCLDFLQAGFVTAVAVDAVESRRTLDKEIALSRAKQAGSLPTTIESALLEMVHDAGGDGFKAILPLIRWRPTPLPGAGTLGHSDSWRHSMIDIYEQLKQLISEIEDDVRKSAGGNKAAGTRVRKVMQDVKNTAQHLRVAVLENREDSGT